MKIETIGYGNWGEALSLVNNDMELVIVTEVGPRIMSFKKGDGPNILFEGVDVDFGRGDWHLYGGHRFWLSPEAEHSFVPDNESCEIETVGNTVRIFQRPDYNGLQKILEISPSPLTGGFIINHILRHVGTLLYQGALWVLTCVQPSRVLAPWGSGSASWKTNMVKYWTTWDGHKTNIASPQWKPTNDYFLIEPTGEEGKVGLFSEEGYMANLRSDATFIKTYDPIIEAQYPDGGCNIELYTCKHFIEMETLSPHYVFHPGREYVHTEHWLLSDQTFEPSQWRQVGDLIFKG